MVTVGALKSTISHSNCAGRKLVWPPLMAWTSNEYSSSIPRFSYAWPDSQGSHAEPVASPVRRHSKVLSDWSESELEGRCPVIGLDADRDGILVHRPVRDGHDRPRQHGPGVARRRDVDDVVLADRANPEGVLTEEGVVGVRGVARAPRGTVERAVELGQRQGGGELELDAGAISGRLDGRVGRRLDDGRVRRDLGGDLDEQRTARGCSRRRTTRPPWSSRLTSIHSPPSKWRTCGSARPVYGRQTVTSPRKAAVVETSK